MDKNHINKLKQFSDQSYDLGMITGMEILFSSLSLKIHLIEIKNMVEKNIMSEGEKLLSNFVEDVKIQITELKKEYSEKYNENL